MKILMKFHRCRMFVNILGSSETWAWEPYIRSWAARDSRTGITVGSW